MDFVHKLYNYPMSILLHRMAANYLACVYPFPTELRPEHLDVPNPGQVFAGLHLLHRLFHDLYLAFTRLEPVNEKAASDEDTCWKTLDGCGLFLWTLGALGERVDSPRGAKLWVQKAALAGSVPGRKVKDIASMQPGLEAAGFRLYFLDSGGGPCAGGWKRCELVGLGWPSNPTEANALWYALEYFARRVDLRQPGVPFAAFLRADFRPLLPGSDPAALPYTIDEAWSALDPATVCLWRAMAGYLASAYPKYVPFFRHPDLRRRTWTVNYDTQAKGYGLFSLYGDDGGFRVRMVLKKSGRAYVLDHIDELSPRMQEMFLNRIPCIDCKHCGQHEFYTHGDHVHKLCAGAWFYSDHLALEDLPSIKRLIAIHVSHLR